MPNQHIKAYDEIKQVITKISKDKKRSCAIKSFRLRMDRVYLEALKSFKINKKPANRRYFLDLLDHTGLEPVTFTMPLYVNHGLILYKRECRQKLRLNKKDKYAQNRGN